jgi:hypothetical protein
MQDNISVGTMALVTEKLVKLKQIVEGKRKKVVELEKKIQEHKTQQKTQQGGNQNMPFIGFPVKRTSNTNIQNIANNPKYHNLIIQIYDKLTKENEQLDKRIFALEQVVDGLSKANLSLYEKIASTDKYKIIFGSLAGILAVILVIVGIVSATKSSELDLKLIANMAIAVTSGNIIGDSIYKFNDDKATILNSNLTIHDYIIADPMAALLIGADDNNDVRDKYTVTYGNIIHSLHVDEANKNIIDIFANTIGAQGAWSKYTVTSKNEGKIIIFTRHALFGQPTVYKFAKQEKPGEYKISIEVEDTINNMKINNARSTGNNTDGNAAAKKKNDEQTTGDSAVEDSFVGGIRRSPLLPKQNQQSPRQQYSPSPRQQYSPPRQQYSPPRRQRSSQRQQYSPPRRQSPRRRFSPRRQLSRRLSSSQEISEIKKITNQIKNLVNYIKNMKDMSKIFANASLITNIIKEINFTDIDIERLKIEIKNINDNPKSQKSIETVKFVSNMFNIDNDNVMLLLKKYPELIAKFNGYIKNQTGGDNINNKYDDGAEIDYYEKYQKYKIKYANKKQNMQ